VFGSLKNFLLACSAPRRFASQPRGQLAPSLASLRRIVISGLTKALLLAKITTALAAARTRPRASSKKLKKTAPFRQSRPLAASGFPQRFNRWRRLALRQPAKKFPNPRRQKCCEPAIPW
jgi:hypothetical protein